MPVTLSTFCGTPEAYGHTSSFMGTPLSIGIDDNGTVYFADIPPIGTRTIRKANQSGVITDVLDYSSALPFASVGMLAVNRRTGEIFFPADDSSAGHTKLYTNSAAYIAGTHDTHITPGAGSGAHLGEVVEIAVDPATGTVYTESWKDGSPGTGVKILKIAGATMSIVAGTDGNGNADGAGTSASFNPSTGMGMAVDDGGNIFLANQETWPGVHNIRKITPAGLTSHVCVLDASTQLTGLCWAPDGNLYAAAKSASTDVMVLRVNPATGDITTVWSDVAIRTSGGVISGIAADWDGNVYIGINGGSKAYTIQKLSGVFTAVPTVVSLPVLSTLTDTFPASTLNTTKWDVTAGTATVTSGGWLALGSGDTTGAIRSDNDYRFDHASAMVTPEPGGQAMLQLQDRSNTDTAQLSIDRTTNTLLAAWSIGGDVDSALVDYDLSFQSWLRISRTDTALTFEASSEGTFWVSVATHPITAGQLRAGKAVLSGNRGAVFDNFNTTPTTSDPPPTEPPHIPPPTDPGAKFTTPASSTPGKGANAGKTCNAVIELIRQFSTDVKRPIRIIDADTIEMVDVNAPLPTGWSVADKDDLYHKTTHEVLAGEKVLSTLSGNLTLNASADLVANDVRLVTSDWIMPEQLPVYGAVSALVRSVSWTFTPTKFEGSLEFKAVPIPLSFRSE
jgi:hypothetical protein